MKYFKVKLIVLFALSLVDLWALAHVLGDANYLFTQLVLFGLFAILLLSIFYFIDTTNKSISKFLFALKYQDYSVRFPEKNISSFSTLHQALNVSIQELKSIKEENSTHNMWALELLQRSPQGILVIRNEEVLFMNSMVTELLETPTLKDLNHLDRFQNGLAKQIKEFSLETRHQVLLENGTELSFYKTQFKDTSDYLFVFIQSMDELKGEIEVDAWSNLFRVMTHEIMNSITSISSLASTLKNQIESEGLSEDLKVAANSIEKRSNSLIHFTDNYRQINDIQSANKTWFNLGDLVQEQLGFLKQELKSIHQSIICINQVNVFADRTQVEQVIINLLLNSQYALIGVSEPKIQIQIKTEKKTVFVSFIDNGIGVPAEIQNDIFIPFFTSKKDGKGIGLSLCRKLMRNNNGSIGLLQSIESHTEFQLRFKQ